MDGNNRIIVKFVAGCFLIFAAGCAEKHVLQTGLKSSPGITSPLEEIKISVNKSSEVRKWGIHKDHRIEHEEINIKRGSAGDIYTIRYNYCSDPVHPREKSPVGDNDTGLGLVVPCISGWYHNNAMEIMADDKLVTRYSRASYAVVKKDKYALVGFCWDAEEVSVFLSFLASNERDGLFCEAVLKPKKKLQSLSIALFNIPGLSLSSAKLAGERWAFTAAGKEALVSSFGDGDTWKAEPDKTMPLSFPEDNWIFYADRVFDCENDQRGGGPSGLFVLPAGIQSGKVTVGGNSIRTSLALPPEGGCFRLAFFEFSKWSNERALNYMQTNAVSISGFLSTCDFQIMNILRSDMEKITAIGQRRLKEIESCGLNQERAVVFNKLKETLADIAKSGMKAGITYDEISSLKTNAEETVKQIHVLGLQTMIEEGAGKDAQ